MAFSGKAIIIKLAYRHGVDAVTLIMLRMAFAMPLFVAIAWWAGRGKPPLSTRHWMAVAGLGFIGYYVASMLDFVGLQYVTARLGRLIQYLTPTIVLVLGWWLFRRRVTARQMAAMAVSYVGVAIVFAQEVSLEGRDVGLGAALVFGSALLYAVYLVCSGEVVKHIGALRLTGLASTLACVLCIVQYLVLRSPSQIAEIPEPVLWLSVINALACTVVPVVLVMMAIERIGPSLTAQAGMVGPMSTVALSAWLLGEPFTMTVLVGTALVLLGVAMVSRGGGQASNAKN